MNKMENIDISAAISLFEIKLSERSVFVRDVKAAENFLREYELAIVTRRKIWYYRYVYHI